MQPRHKFENPHMSSRLCRESEANVSDSQQSLEDMFIFSLQNGVFSVEVSYITYCRGRARE